MVQFQALIDSRYFLDPSATLKKTREQENMIRNYELQTLCKILSFVTYVYVNDKR